MIILTEKPSVAKDIANGLGNFSYTKKGFWLSPQNDCIVSAAGHLLELCQPEDYDEKYAKWKIEDLPILPDKMRYIPKKETSSLLKKIKECFDTYDSSNFILATDQDREGELIGALILNYIHFNHYETARRFWVSEALTPDVVKNGIQNAKPLTDYDSLKNAGYARNKADWIIGMNVSRLLTVSVKKLLTFGRVQTAILGAIYLRERNIKNFQPVPYFQMNAIVKNKDGSTFNMLLQNRDSDRFSSRSDSLLEAAEQFVAQKKSLEITKVNSNKKIEYPPQLFNMTGLQKYCAEKYQITPKRTLEIAQELYEKLKCLSYPRTPSVVLGDDNVELYKEKYDLLSKKYPKYSAVCDIKNISSENKRLFNTAKLEAHHGLIPLAALPDEATEEQKLVYESVLLRFFQTIMPAYEYTSTEVEAIGKCNIALSSSDLIFKTTGKTVLQNGWKSSLSSDDQKNAEGKCNVALSSEEEKLPVLSEHETLNVDKYDLLSKETKPKKHFTNSSLLALMENPKGEDPSNGKLAGIGTEATRAGIIAELVNRQYIKQDKQNLLMTELGTFLIETVLTIPVLAKFISIGTTTQWEQQLHDCPNQFLDSIKNFIKTDFLNITIEREWKEPDKPSLGACPVCGKGKIIEGKSSFYCSDYKTTGCKFSIWKEICGAKITAADAQLLLSGKATRSKKFTSKKGASFSAKLKYLNQKIEFVFENKK